MRMENELAVEREGVFDLKFGKGGLLDIEFCIQWLQMRHGRDLTVYASRTLEALDALERSEVLREPQARTLRSRTISAAPRAAHARSDGNEPERFGLDPPWDRRTSAPLRIS